VSALKYTDRDVRERPELVAEAVRYLRWYQGEFEFLVDAKRYEVANGSLSVATARGVLNCIRQDTRYAMVSDPIPEPSVSHPRRLRVVVDQEKRREPFDLKTYWNARLMWSAHKGAVVVHAMRPDASLRYFPMAHDEKISIYVGIRSLCSTGFPRNLTRLGRIMPEGKRFCHRCVADIEEFGYDWGPTTPPASCTQVPTSDTFVPPST